LNLVQKGFFKKTIAIRNVLSAW